MAIRTRFCWSYWLIGLALVGHPTRGQENNWALFLLPEQYAYVQYTTDLAQQLQQKKKHYKSDERFLRLCLAEIHTRFLHQYQPYATLSETLGQGRYNCVSAVALVGLLLTDLGYRVDLQEAPLHTFLWVEVGTQRWLVEPTDAANGLTTTDESIAQRMAAYQAPLAQLSIAAQLFPYSIDFEQLAGLQAFNEAVVAYNNRHYVQAAYHLTEAEKVYPHWRVEVLQARNRKMLASLSASRQP